MKMFLTRLGFGSKMVVTGDITQIDLPGGRQSGLVTVPEVLMNLSDIAFVNFDSRDVVRHKLVQRIVAAYKESDERAGGAAGRRRSGRAAPAAVRRGAGHAAASPAERLAGPWRVWRGAMTVSLIEVVNQTRTLVDESAVAALCAAVLVAEGASGAELGVRFVGETRMRALNREHRGIDQVTDVLSFSTRRGGRMARGRSRRLRPRRLRQHRRLRLRGGRCR